MPSILTPDLGLFVWMLLAFLLVFGLLAKFGFPVIINMVNDRKNYLDDSLKTAREANEKLANIKSESEAILKAAREEQARIIREAMATRDGIIKEARDRAQAEGHKLLEEAKAQISVEKENALRDIRGTVAVLSVGIAEKVIGRELSDSSAQERYIQSLLDDVAK